MPIAAAPEYLPDRLFAEASPGLRFGMYLRLWGINRRNRTPLWTTHDLDYETRGQDRREREVQYENKRSALCAACPLSAGDRRTLAALALRQRRLAEPLEKSGTAVVLDAVAVAPFTTGLGNEHPLENGFAFLDPYGLPYLPGSGVKGVVRQAARELASGDWGEASGWNRADTIHLSLTDVLFGRETPSGESTHVRGALTFWDVFPQIAGDRLLVEVMTAHQSHYYQQGLTPHDSGSPNPINFLTIPPKSRFAFYVLCDLAHLRRLAAPVAEDDRWRDLIGSAFRHAFEWLGFGAKTAVGYGAFKPSIGSLNSQAAHHAPEPAANRVSRSPEARAETVWDRAQIRFDQRNGTLVAIGPGNVRANALAPRGIELLSRLPEDVQRRIRANQFVRAVARARGTELVDVESR
jgi:CRISPR-associated protein Cmr6